MWAPNGMLLVGVPVVSPEVPPTEIDPELVVELSRVRLARCAMRAETFSI